MAFHSFVSAFIGQRMYSSMTRSDYIKLSDNGAGLKICSSLKPIPSQNLFCSSSSESSITETCLSVTQNPPCLSNTQAIFFKYLIFFKFIVMFEV